VPRSEAPVPAKSYVSERHSSNFRVRSRLLWHSAGMPVDAGGSPSGIVTFLFTEGSTRRWEADADAMRTALADQTRTELEHVG
jgi:hypothetical protein